MIRAPKTVLLGLAVAADGRCPHHAGVEAIMRCPRCRRRFEDHVQRIARLPTVEKPS